MEQPKPLLPMPIKAAPYRHQISAFNFVCGKFGLIPSVGMPSPGAALLMEMGTGKTITSIAVAGALRRGDGSFVLTNTPSIGILYTAW